MKDVQATGEAFSPQKRTSSTLKPIFFLFLWVILPSWIRILAFPMRIGSSRPKSIVIHNTGFHYQAFSSNITDVRNSVADPGSLSRIPDPNFFHPGSRIRTVIPDPGSASKNLSILTPKKPKKCFLSSRKYDLGCSSRIPDP
jgi:hypothetical protein